MKSMREQAIECIDFSIDFLASSVNSDDLESEYFETLGCIKMAYHLGLIMTQEKKDLIRVLKTAHIETKNKLRAS